MKTLLQVGVVAALFAAAACKRADSVGPPVLRLGRDECGECGMTIHDERCSSALLVDRGGRREHVLFDDIGCMLDVEQSRAGELKVIARFVHDHDSGAWIPAGAAAFLAADSALLLTPMASGMVAFAADEAAAEAKQRFGGQIMDYVALGAHRRVWKEKRQGASGG